MRTASRLVTLLLLAACGPTPRAKLELSSSTLDFGVVSPGRVVVQSVEFRNTGDASLTVTRVTSTGASVTMPAYSPSTTAGLFAVDLELALALAPNETRTVQISYQPTSTSTDEASLEFFLDDGEAAATLRLMGIAPTVDCDNPPVFDFGGVAVGETAELERTFLNARPVPAEVFVGELQLSAGDTTLTVPPGEPRGTITLPPGGSRTVRWSFTPVAVQRSVARVFIRQDLCSYTARIVGDGVPTAFIAPASATLGDVVLGQTSRVELTFFNHAFKPVTLSGLSLWEGTSPSAAFQIAATGTADLSRLVVASATRDANGDLVPGSGTLSLVFRPGVTGPQVAQLRAQTDLTVRPSLALSVSGVGIP